MSWLFGLNNKGSIGEAPQVPVLGDDSGSGDGNEAPVTSVQDGQSVDTGYRSEAYSFDSTALERAAKAAKVLITLYCTSNEISIIEHCIQQCNLIISFHFL